MGIGIGILHETSIFQGFAQDRALHMSFSHDDVMNRFAVGHVKNIASVHSKNVNDPDS